MGVAGNVIAGSGLLRIAPIGTALPSIDGTVYPPVWPAAWVQTGYTDQGIDLSYEPTFKDITVDEELGPIKMKLTAEKAFFSCVMAEATLENINKAIAGSGLVINTATTTHTKTLGVGSAATDIEMMVGFEGLAPSSALDRVIICTRAKATAKIAMKMQRTDKTVVALEFMCLADSTLPAGSRLFRIIDFGNASFS
jgi:stage V sporulation protein SpoVS